MDKFLALMRIASQVMHLVPVVESLIPIRGKGREKLDLGLRIIASITPPDVAALVPPEEMQTVVSNVASATIAAMKQTGMTA